jgi:hypothetical protein
MTRGALLSGVVVVAIGAGAWIARDSAWRHPVAARLGLPAVDSAPDAGRALAAAGVHKCRVGAQVVYTDQPCPRGSRELAATGGTVSVVPFPQPAAPTASGIASGALIRGMNQEQIEQLREKMIEQAGDR